MPSLLTSISSAVTALVVILCFPSNNLPQDVLLLHEFCYFGYQPYQVALKSPGEQLEAGHGVQIYKRFHVHQQCGDIRKWHLARIV